MKDAKGVEGRLSRIVELYKFAKDLIDKKKYGFKDEWVFVGGIKVKEKGEVVL